MRNRGPLSARALEGLHVCTVVLRPSRDADAQPVVVEARLNLRPSPSEAESRLGLLSPGYTVERVGPDSLVNGCFRARAWTGREGWVAMPFAHQVRPPL